MYIKTIAAITILSVFLIGCRTKNQCSIYSNIINKNIRTDYYTFLKEQADKIKNGELKPDPLDHYINFNNCNRKNILFSFAKDSIFVMEKNVDDDYAGTIVNMTSFYKKNKVFFFRSTNKGIDSLIVDSDYILNNKQNNEFAYRYILQLKESKLEKTNNFSESKCIPMKDFTYVSLIVDKDIKKIYRICSGELIQLYENK